MAVPSQIKIESLFQGCGGKKKSTRHLVQPAQESFLPYVSTTFSPKSWGSRRHRTDHSLKATVLGEEESHNCFLALAHPLLESLPSAGCRQAQWGTRGMICVFAGQSLAGSHPLGLGIIVLDQTSDAICDPRQ